MLIVKNGQGRGLEIRQFFGTMTSLTINPVRSMKERPFSVKYIISREWGGDPAITGDKSPPLFLVFNYSDTEDIKYVKFGFCKRNRFVNWTNLISRTGLPTKDETLETNVRNLHGLFLIFMLLCNCNLVSLFAKSYNKPFKDYIQVRDNLILELS